MSISAAQAEPYAAARLAAWVDLSAREQLELVGPDRVSFLHGMVTSEVEKLAVGASQPAAMLTAKGAMVAEVRVLKLPERLIIDCEPGAGAAVRGFLEKYLISEECEVREAPQLAVLGLYGSAQLSGLAPLVGLHGTTADVLLDRSGLEAARASLAAVPLVDAQTFEVLRVEAGLPRWGADLVETTIPLEASLDRAISYTKGCYIGQEVIARATHRGQMQRKLAGLKLGTQEPAAGVELRRAEKKVGWLTSVVRSPKCGEVIALGYLHRDCLAPGTVVELASGGTATVAALPF